MDSEFTHRVQTEYFRTIVLIMSVAQMMAGGTHFHDCPKQPVIPLYLLFMGFIFLLLAVYTIPSPERSMNNNKICGSILCVFFFCWFITGNVWIYSIYEPNYNKTASSTEAYCDKTLYLFAFWSTNLNHILLVFMLLCFCWTWIFCGVEHDATIQR